MTTTQEPAQAVSALVSRLRETSLPPPSECRRIRRSVGASQSDVARALGVNPLTVSQWEQGKASPSRRMRTPYRRLLEALEALAAEVGGGTRK